MDRLFQGKNGFIWWFGEVESNGDPMGVGRCRVRIHGWHNPSIEELPTDALPWAYPITPITNAGVAGVGKSPTGLLPGSVVFGFFLDGESGQSPIMIGVAGGVTQTESTRATENGSTDWFPNVFSIFKKEGDNISPQETDSVNVNTDPVDPRMLNINKSEWCVPFSGFVSSAFGESRGNGTHLGVDICPAGFFKQTDKGASHINGVLKGPAGLPVYAAAAGKVVCIFRADRGQGGRVSDYDKLGPNGVPKGRSFGNAVAITHELSTGTYTTIYAHLGVSQDAAKDAAGAGISVGVGDTVSKGQQIGTVGRSHVWDSLTHLHFEIRTGTALPVAPNAINPGRVFPQLAHQHQSFTKTVLNKQYDISPLPFKKSDMPVRAKDGPE